METVHPAAVGVGPKVKALNVFRHVFAVDEHPNTVGTCGQDACSGLPRRKAKE